MSFITFVAVLPSVSLAASNRYNFTMSYRVVDGSENGKFMTLSKGTANISGTHQIISSLPDPLGPYTLNYQLYNKTSGNSFGIVKATPSTTERSVSGSYSGLGGGTSYLSIADGLSQQCGVLSHCMRNFDPVIAAC